MGLNLILKGMSVSQAKRVDTIDYQQYVDLFLQSCFQITTTERDAVQALATTLISAGLFGKLDCIYPILGSSERMVGLNLRSPKYILDFNPPKSTGGIIKFEQGGIYVDTIDETGRSCAPINTQLRHSSPDTCIFVSLGTKVKDYYNPKPISLSFQEVGKINQNTITSIIYTNTGLYSPNTGNGVQVGIMQDVNAETEELIQIQGLQDPSGTLFANRFNNTLTLRHNGVLVDTKTITQSFDSRNCMGSFVLGHVSSNGSYTGFNNPIKLLIIGAGLTEIECNNLQTAVDTFLIATGK